MSVRISQEPHVRGSVPVCDNNAIRYSLFHSVQRKHISVRLAEATSRMFSTYSPFGAMLFGFVVVHNSKLHTGGRVCNVRLSCLIVPLSAIACIFSPCVRNISIGVMRRCF